MVSKRIKYARAHLSRRKHIAILATPLWRRTQKSDFNCQPRAFSVPRAALRARATKRIKIMAQPKLQIQKRFRSLSRTKRLGAEQLDRRMQQQQQQQQGERGVVEPSKRILDLSLPKKSALLHARRYGSSVGNQNLLVNISSTLQAIRKSRYLKYRVICNSLAHRAAAREAKIRRKLHRVLKKPEDWERHNKVLKRLAAPKLVPKPPRPHQLRMEAAAEKKKKLFDPARTNVLAQPTSKRTDDGKDPFAVQASALTYRITERVEKLASVEPRRVPRYREPGAVSPHALHYTASDRLVELAKPAERQPGLETNLKENAFAVLPRALKAICRPRVKILAKPKHRPRKL